MPPGRLSTEGAPVLGGIQNSPQDDRGYRPEPHSGLVYVLLVADPLTGGGHCISVLLGLIPFLFEILVQSA